MSDFKRMSRQEQLEAIANAYKGEAPRARPVRMPTLEEESAPPIINPQVDPGQPDPEAAVNALIARRINAQRALDPDSIVRDSELAAEEQLDPLEQQKRDLKIEMLRNAVKTGKFAPRKSAFE